MKGRMTMTTMRWLLALLATFALSTGTAWAQAEEQVLVDAAKETVERIKADPDYEIVKELLAKSYGAFVFPSLVKASLIVGGEGGSGVLLRRDFDTGRWGYPAFYDLASGSVGLQIGITEQEVLLIIMTKDGLELAMNDKFTLGADAKIAVGPVGGGAEAASTTNVDADIYAFSKAEGLFGGISVEGAVLIPDQDAHQRYYGTRYTSRQIIFDEVARNEGADGLRDALVRP
jgi:lipid-binding SYLF domain-containing protein